MRISTKLILILVSAVISVMSVYALVTVSRTQERLQHEEVKMAEHVGMALSVGVLHHMMEGDYEGVLEVVETMTSYEDVIGVGVYDLAGRLVAVSGEIEDTLPDPASWAGGADPDEGLSAPLGSESCEYHRAIRSSDGATLGWLHLVLGQQSLLPHVLEARNHVLIAIVGLSGVLILMIVYASRRYLAGPLRLLSDGAMAIGDGRLDQRIEVADTSEIGDLARAFNQMAASLQANTDQIVSEREYIRSIVNSIADGITVLDKEGCITAWNSTMESRYGRGAVEALGVPLVEVFSEFAAGEMRAGIEAALKGEPGPIMVGRTRLSAAPERDIAVSITPLREAGGEANGAVVALADVTERLWLEQQIQRSEKLAAVGQLAAGIAHEIGTPLNVISGSAEYLQMDMEHDDTRAEELQCIAAEVTRISELVKQLMAFARPAEPSVESVELSEVVEATLLLVRHLLERQSIGVELTVAHDLPPVRADRGQLQQVILNLVVNAMHAMPKGGLLALRAMDSHGGHRIAETGLQVALEVTDTGAGIPVDVVPRIFDPFFTTKDVGEGTGLGLSTAQRIIENHGGQLAVRSEVGRGTTFTVLLPQEG